MRTLAIFLLFFQHLAFSQPTQDFSKIDRAARAVPVSATQSISILGKYLATLAANDLEKSRAVYVWVTSNIVYADTVISNNWLGTPENTVMQKAENVLKNRAGVCEGYANLYVELCRATGLRAEELTGLVRQKQGKIPDTGHAWAAVEVEKEWFLSDPTWGSGFRDPSLGRFSPKFDETYFLQRGATFLLEHLPDDPMWQFLFNPISERQFRSWKDADLLEKANSAQKTFIWPDTLKNWLRLDSLERKKSEAVRMLKFNPENDFAAARLGVWFFQNALEHAEKLDLLLDVAQEDPSQPLDTASMWLSFYSMEENLGRGYDFFKPIKNPRLKILVEGLPPLDEMRSEIDYLRATLRFKIFMRMIDVDFQRESDFVFPEFQRNEMLRIFSKIEKTGRRNRPGAEEKRSRMKIKSATVAGMWGIVLAQFYGEVQNVPAEKLKSNLQKLDKAEAAYFQMKKSLDDIPMVHLNLFGGAILKSQFPELMASLESRRSALQLEIVQPDLDNFMKKPDAATVVAAKNLENRVGKCAERLDEGLKFLKNVRETEKTNGLQAQIFGQKANLAFWQGDLHLTVVLKEYNGAKTAAALANRKSLILNEIGQAKAFYAAAKTAGAAAEKFDAGEKDEQLAKLLAGRAETIKTVENELKK